MHHVGEHAHEQTHHHVERDECEPGEQAEFGVRQTQIGHDEIREARQQLAVDEVHDVQQRQKCQERVVARLDRAVSHVSPPRWPADGAISRR